MHKSRKLSNKELGMVDGARLYVCIDGGREIPAEVVCKGGEMQIKFEQGGDTKYYNTGLDLGRWNFANQAKCYALGKIESDRVINYTYSISASEVES